MLPLLSVLLLTVSYTCIADPIIIRSGVGGQKEGGHHEDAKIFDLNTSKGVSQHQGEEAYDKNNEQKHVQAGDSGKFLQEDGQKNLNENQKHYADSHFHQGEGGQQADFNKKSNNKKGHHKSGFTNSYHKDETGSSSSYYDDSDNQGNEYIKKNNKNYYGDSGKSGQQATQYDGKKYIQDGGKKGYYNNQGNFDRDAGSNRGYHSRRYYDGHENEGRRNKGDMYGDRGRFEEEKYLQKTPYYGGHVEHNPQRTITIYEDPRYEGYEKYPNEYGGDYIQLELKRPPRDYDYRDYYRYEDKAPYDYYYYY